MGRGRALPGGPQLDGQPPTAGHAGRHAAGVREAAHARGPAARRGVQGTLEQTNRTRGGERPALARGQGPGGRHRNSCGGPGAAAVWQGALPRGLGVRRTRACVCQTPRVKCFHFILHNLCLSRVEPGAERL